eukprot:TRINITY_DN507_c0_g1_i2.p1 TRINITY_DN507_c0_g1~~TRINITY_DN507_c0_g1_i2.p1  ORF type:complete len:255 (+),score=57.27 TRINITY_DN507_c0_g1_i2:151-915(+)
MLLVRRSSLRFPQQTHRNYAQISHKRPLVIPQYHLPIRTIEAELRSITEVGKSRCRNMRKAAGKEERIPAVLMIPGQDPVYLKVRASTITKFMNDNHFLGRRYNLVVNDRTYDVYPCTLGVHPVTYIPESCTFSLWNGHPKVLWDPERRKIERRGENEIINYNKLNIQLKEISKYMKDQLSRSSVEVHGLDEIYATYNPNARSERLKSGETLESETLQMLEKYWKDPKSLVLSLEKEERDVDEIHEVVEDEEDQ